MVEQQIIQYCVSTEALLATPICAYVSWEKLAIIPGKQGRWEHIDTLKSWTIMCCGDSEKTHFLIYISLFSSPSEHNARQLFYDPLPALWVFWPGQHTISWEEITQIADAYREPSHCRVTVGQWACCILIIITCFAFFLLRSESDELSSLVSMNSRLLKLSLPPPRSLSLSPPVDFFFSSFLPPDFLLSLTDTPLGGKRCV